MKLARISISRASFRHQPLWEKNNYCNISIYYLFWINELIHDIIISLFSNVPKEIHNRRDIPLVDKRRLAFNI